MSISAHGGRILCDAPRRAPGPVVSAERLGDLVWAAESLAVALVDADGRVVEANGTLHELAGRSPVGGRLIELVAPAQRTLVGRFLREADGGWRSMLISMFPDSQGLVRDFRLFAQRSREEAIVVAEPVQEQSWLLNDQLLALNDELLAARRELATKNRRLQELDQVKDAFVASISHDLRSPITSIIGYAELLDEGEVGELGNDQHDVVKVVLRNARRLLGMVEDLLTASQIQAGRLELRSEATDLALVLADTLEAVRPGAEQHGIELELEVEPVPRAVVDGERLARVFDNLLSNAVKFTPDGGRIAVRLCRDGASAVVEVSDTGIGIDSAEVSHVFERFRRASSATEHGIEGTGLGLANARTIVEAHGGSIQLESELGSGTTVTVRLPLEAGS